jgi:hypothetical protein
MRPLLIVCSVFWLALVCSAESNVIIERDPVTGKVTMRSKPSGELDNPNEPKQSPAYVTPSAPKPAQPASRVDKSSSAPSPVGRGPSALAIVGLGIAGLGYFALLVTMATVNPLWIIGGIVFPPSSLIFVFTNWQVSKVAFFMNLVGGAIYLTA